MDKALIILGGTCAILLWAFWPSIRIWWYKPWCAPCRRYCIFKVDQILEAEDSDSYYQCPGCGRTCEIEDAMSLKNG